MTYLKVYLKDRTNQGTVFFCLLFFFKRKVSGLFAPTAFILILKYSTNQGIVFFCLPFLFRKRKVGAYLFFFKRKVS